MASETSSRSSQGIQVATRIKVPKQQLKQISDQLRGLPQAFTERDAKELGQDLVSEMKSMISKGQSTIEGNGRFPGYKRAQDKDGYPNNVRKKHPQKRARPVNLFLSGDFLRDLVSQTFKGKLGYGLQVGFFKPESVLKELSHRIGENGQPSRPVIPEANERLAARLRVIISNKFREVFSRVFKKSA